MNQKQHPQELLILKTIAETLNRSTHLESMLKETLEKLLEVMGLQTGWIFLVDEKPIFHHVADHRLPPALSRERKRPMRCGNCLCLRLYWSGQLNQAVNIIQCERLYEANLHQLGDTENLTHHATVPLTIRGESFGILNVGAPGKEYFHEEELALLEGVALQIGTAVERTRLYAQKQQEAVNQVANFIVRYYEQMNEATRSVWHIHDQNQLLTTITQQIGTYFAWETVAVFLAQSDHLVLNALYHEGTTSLPTEKVAIKELLKKQNQIGQSFLKKRPLSGKANTSPYTALPIHPGNHTIAIPITSQDSSTTTPLGVLYIERATPPYSALEIQMLQILSDQIMLGLQKVRLYEEQQKLLLAEERNRLARDLHDSVNQKLFSLSLMARGFEYRLQDPELVKGMHQIGELAQEVLSEMRSLIWQLHPLELEQGILSSLQRYGEKLGLQVRIEKETRLRWKQEIEEALLRIGQEALNNIRKHAQTDQATVGLGVYDGKAILVISDPGCGFNQEKVSGRSFGMTSMRERAERIQGKIDVVSEVGKGTCIRVVIPMD